MRKILNGRFSLVNEQEKGITLVALVITIVVIIILAVVTINFAFGQGGIVQQAQSAAEYYANDTKYTEEAVANVISYLNKIVDGSNIEEINTPAIDGSFSKAEGVNTPKIGANMQLVVFNSETNTWIEDTSKEAYSYLDTSVSGKENKSEWANAKVTIDGIDSYFVWIPRYAYKITYYTDSSKTTVSNTPTAYGTIDIKFINGTGNISADGTVCKYASEKPDATKEYVVHSAFTDEVENGGWDKQIPGMWIGKYEASSVEGNSNSTADDVTTKTVQVKAGVSSWRHISIATMFTVAKTYSSNLESHMLKNSEWGAVVYLTESQYGRNGTEVTVNNNGETYYTGGGAGNAYITNTVQSSTGNVYGIYDLSGNAYEYVAAAYLSQGDIETTDGSTKYATVYNGISTSSAYKYGDATYETGGWHSNKDDFTDLSLPFFARGGSYDYENTGIFFCSAGSGSRALAGSFRLALVV